MKRLRLDGEQPLQAVVNTAVSVLRHGGVVAFPTETFYGLAADVTSRLGCERVYALKGRSPDKSLPWIVANIGQLERFAVLSRAARCLAERFWPGPLTLVVASRDGGSIAGRVSSLALARSLAESLGEPITSTSANRQGEPPAASADALVSLSGLDLILDAGPSPGGAPSTIVDVTGTMAKLVRPGAIAFDDVVRVLAESSLIG